LPNITPEITLSARNLTRRFGNLSVIQNVSLELKRGEVLGLLGYNGAGKTTTLECCIGIGKPTAGTIRVLGLDPTNARDLVRLRRRMGVQLQATSLPEKRAPGLSMSRSNSSRAGVESLR